MKGCLFWQNKLVLPIEVNLSLLKVLTVLSFIFLVVVGTALFTAPRHLAAIPFFIGCSYMTVGQGLDLGVNLPIVRLLLLVGLVRLHVKGETMGPFNLIDKLLVFWCCWLIFASFFHEWEPGSGPKFTVGIAVDTFAFYYIVRCLVQDPSELRLLVGTVCLILVPVAVLMVVEQATQKNFFSIFGGVPETPNFRNGRYRAQGPFSHAILAGNIGAACFPFAVAMWRTHRTRAVVGGVATGLMVVACASSGPILSLGFGIFAMGLWFWPSVVGVIRKSIIPGYVLLALVMERPPYYLISKINLTGASTGWHRSFLIEQTIKHFDEWWLFGTDRTRHWMPGQGAISLKHTDVTNQFIAYGVNGGFLCMMVFIVMMGLAFATVGRVHRSDQFTDDEKFLTWCLGGSLFALATSAISVAYFGQSIFFFWFPLALLSSMLSCYDDRTAEEEEEEEEAEQWSAEPYRERGF